MRHRGRTIELVREVHIMVCKGRRVMIATLSDELPKSYLLPFERDEIPVTIEKVDGGFMIELAKV